MLCFHPDHSLTLARMTTAEIRKVVDAWIREYEELGGLEWIKYVQIFENRGAMMGASNPHPHGQIWSTGFVPDEPAAETVAQREHLAKTGHCLLCDYLAAEDGEGERVIFENDHFTVLVPWWATWPFEALVVSRRHIGAMPDFNDDEREGLADALRRMATRFDNLFETSFPYTIGFHQAPTDPEALTRSGISMPISIHPCCVQRRCGNSWWALKCWVCHNATSPPEIAAELAAAPLLRGALLAEVLTRARRHREKKDQTGTARNEPKILHPGHWVVADT